MFWFPTSITQKSMKNEWEINVNIWAEILISTQNNILRLLCYTYIYRNKTYSLGTVSFDRKRVYVRLLYVVYLYDYNYFLTNFTTIRYSYYDNLTVCVIVYYITNIENNNTKIVVNIYFLSSDCKRQ